MEPVFKYIHQQQVVLNKEIDEDELIKKLEIALNQANDHGCIELFFPVTYFQRHYLVTILQFAVVHKYERLAGYALSRGASTATKIRFGRCSQWRRQNALELAVGHSPSSIFEMVRKRSLELYASYGLNAFHIDCALDMAKWSDDSRQRLRTANVNATISTESKFWPGMTPLLIAAKFENEDLVRELLNRGADAVVRDPEGNTPLHYSSNRNYPPFYDERLFAFDAANTFGSFTGWSHFHHACSQCPRALHIVKRYLDRGISPDLPVQSLDCEGDYEAGRAGLHIAAKSNCQELARLLLEYGAKVDQEDLEGRTPINFTTGNSSVATLCLFIEAGSNQKNISFQDLVYSLINHNWENGNRLDFLTCIKKLSTLSQKFVSKKLMDCYLLTVDGWNETEYADRCSEELRTLTDLGLRQILDDTAIVRSDFKAKFGWIDSLDFGSYPIYGSLLSLRFKRKLVEFKKKSGKIRQAIPLVQRLFVDQIPRELPYLCADIILWSMSDEEIAQFLAQR